VQGKSVKGEMERGGGWEGRDREIIELVVTFLDSFRTALRLAKCLFLLLRYYCRGNQGALIREQSLDVIDFDTNKTNYSRYT
jgi:hypothetical protein